MKNLIKTLIIFAFAIIIASCSKDQKCVNWLEGEWNVVKWEVTDSNGITVDLIAASSGTVSGKMEFTKYNVKNDENGHAIRYVYINTQGNTVTQTYHYDYKIQDDCETAWIKEEGSSTADLYSIEESSKTKMIFSDYNENSKETLRITIEKQ